MSKLPKRVFFALGVCSLALGLVLITLVMGGLYFSNFRAASEVDEIVAALRAGSEPFTLEDLSAWYGNQPKARTLPCTISRPSI